MVSNVKTGTGVVGYHLEFLNSDAYVLCEVTNLVRKALESKLLNAAYNKIPYDKRGEYEKPETFELNQQHLQSIYNALAEVTRDMALDESSLSYEFPLRVELTKVNNI